MPIFYGGCMITKVVSCDNSHEIVSLEQFCEHSRITDLYDEIAIQQCLDAAIDSVQVWLNRKLYPTRIVGISDNFAEELYLPFPTIRKINSISAEDKTYTDVILQQSVDWKFDGITEYVRFLPTSTTKFTQLKRFRVDYECGYCPDTDPIPPAVIHAILMTAATLYENREDVVVGTQINNVPLDAQRLIRVHRIRTSQ